MKIILPVAIALSISSGAFAQSPAAQSGPQNAPVKAMDTNNASKPVAGKNSFTMEQAADHIKARGYTRVSSLKLDANGVWRGKAVKAGTSVDVSLDYQGNVH